MDLYSALNPFLKIIYAVIVLILTIISVKIVSFVLNNLKRLDNNITLIYALKDLINFIIYVIAIISLFSIFGIDLKGILVSIGIVGIALSFAAKDFIADFMSGFFIIAYKTLEVGDVMQINTLKGEIKKIGLRSVTVLTEIGDTIIIPNSTLSTTPYIRFKKNELEKAIIKINIPFKINLEEIKEEILNIINSYDEIMKNPKAVVEAKEIGENGPIINVTFWVKTFNKKEEYKFIITDQIRKIINEKLGDDN